MTTTEQITQTTRHQILTRDMTEAMKDRWYKAPQFPYEAPFESTFYDQNNTALDFLPAPDIERIAADLIADCDELSHLKDVDIIYLWKRKGGNHQGKLTLGKCVKPSGLVAYFSETTWIVWLAADNVNEYQMSRIQVEALTMHELLHAAIDDKGLPQPVDHDFAGFAAEVRRYGAWQDDLKLCKAAWEQPPLFDVRNIDKKSGEIRD